MFYDILERNKAFLFFKNKKFKKSKNWPFCKGVNQWFWSKNGHFFNFFFSGNIGQENVFYDILEQKNTFLGYKNKKFKKSKNCNFSKGVNPWFWSKKGLFFNFFFLSNIGQEHFFYDILEQKKTPFKAIKSRSSKSGNIAVFRKWLTHGLGPKIHFFSTSFF